MLRPQRRPSTNNVATNFIEGCLAVPPAAIKPALCVRTELLPPGRQYAPFRPFVSLACFAFVGMVHLAFFLPAMAAATVNVPAPAAHYSRWNLRRRSGDIVLVAPGSYFENINFNERPSRSQVPAALPLPHRRLENLYRSRKPLPLKWRQT